MGRPTIDERARKVVDTGYSGEALYQYVRGQLSAAVSDDRDVKNVKYGNSSHMILAVLFPNGIPVEKYPDALAIIRIIDKLFRIATDRGTHRVEKSK